MNGGWWESGIALPHQSPITNHQASLTGTRVAAYALDAILAPMTRAEAKQIAKAWRKSRIAARILLREDRGRLTPRDIRIGRALGSDPGVTPRLIGQALHGIESYEYRRLGNSSWKTPITAR